MNNEDGYEQSGFDHATYIEFANMVHHFDETARPAHDNIDFNHDHEVNFDDIDIDSDQFDATEYDNNGLPVTLYGVIIYNFEYNEDDCDFWDDIPDGYDSDDIHEYNKSYYRFPYSAPRRSPCMRGRAKNYYRKHPGVPPV